MMARAPPRNRGRQSREQAPWPIRKRKANRRNKRARRKRMGRDGLTSHTAGDTRSTGSRHSEQSDALTQRTAVTREAQNGSGESSGDPLAEQVRALGFDDPADSAAPACGLARRPTTSSVSVAYDAGKCGSAKTARVTGIPVDSQFDDALPFCRGNVGNLDLCKRNEGKPESVLQMLANSSSATLAYDKQDHRESTARRHDRTADVDPMWLP